LLLLAIELQYKCSVSNGTANSKVDAAFERELQYRCSISSGNVKISSKIAAIAQ